MVYLPDYLRVIWSPAIRPLRNITTVYFEINMYFYADLIKINKFYVVYNFVIYFTKRQRSRPIWCPPHATCPPLLILTQNSAQFNAGADKLQTLIQNLN